MAVKNSLVKTEEKPMTYLSNGAEITLTIGRVKKFLVQGQADKVTDKEVVEFMNLCKYNGLNPFIREAYLIKYGSNATMVVSKEALVKRAEQNDDYDGFEAGVYVLSKDSELEERKGAMVLPNEEVVGGWARVYRKGYRVPIETGVAFEEYVGKTSNGETNAQWKSKPATMIRKVAIAQALREAFPNNLNQLFTAEEMSLAEEDLPKNAVPVDDIGDITPNEVVTEVIDHEQNLFDVEPPIDDTEELPFK